MPAFKLAPETQNAEAKVSFQKCTQNHLFKADWILEDNLKY